MEGKSPPHIVFPSASSLASVCESDVSLSLFQWCITFHAVRISCSSFIYNDQPESGSNKFLTIQLQGFSPDTQG